VVRGPPRGRGRELASARSPWRGRPGGARSASALEGVEKVLTRRGTPPASCVAARFARRSGRGRVAPWRCRSSSVGEARRRKPAVACPAGAGCAKRTTRRSPAVTSTQPTRLPQPWQRYSEVGAAVRAEAVVPRPSPARLGLADCDSAPSLLGGRLRASTITSCVGMDRIEGGRDLDHRAVAWPGLAVISSLPAPSLLPIVQTSDAVRAGRGAGVRGDAAVSVVDGDRVAGCPNACEGGSLPERDRGVAASARTRHSGSRRVLLTRERLDRFQRAETAASIGRASSRQSGVRLVPCSV
jgi:hypothetical protein